MFKTNEDHKLYNIISNMNIAFGNKKGLSLDENGALTEKGVSRLKSQIKNLYDENLELQRDGFKAQVRSEIFDAISDLSVFLYGANHFIDLPLGTFDIKINEETGISIPYIEEGKTQFLHFSLANKEEAKKHIEEFSFPMIEAFVDQMMYAVDNKDLELYEKMAIDLAVLLFTIFELFKKEDQTKHTMLYLNQKVNDSNLSKLCRNMEEVEDTLNFYRRKDVEVDFKESELLQDDGKPFLIVYSTKDQIVHDREEDGTFIFNTDGTPFMKEYRENKFLKNTKWFEPDLSEF